MWLNDGWQFSTFSLTSATRVTPWSDTPDLGLPVSLFSIREETWMIFRWIWKREWPHSAQLPPFCRYISSEQVFSGTWSWALQNLHPKEKQAFVPTALDLGAKSFQSQREKSAGQQAQTTTLLWSIIKATHWYIYNRPLCISHMAPNTGKMSSIHHVR